MKVFVDVNGVFVCFQSHNKDDDMGRPSQDAGGTVGGRQCAAPEQRRVADAGGLAADHPQHTRTRFISHHFTLILTRSGFLI